LLHTIQFSRNENFRAEFVAHKVWLNADKESANRNVINCANTMHLKANINI
jgi:hypothetical protein